MAAIRRAAGFFGALSLVGCSDTGGANEKQTPGPQYVISTGVFSDTGSTGYLVSVPSLASDVTYDLSRAVQLPAGANIFAGPTQGAVYVASFDAATFDRWQVEDDGSLTPGASVSFANLGLSSAFSASLSPFFSADKAYFVDNDNRQVIVWDPREMAVVGAIPIEVEAEGELKPWIDTTLTVQADVVVANVYWKDGDWLRFGDHVRQIMIDPKTDKVVRSADDLRANQLTPGGVVSNGTAYFAPSSTVAPVRSVFGAEYGAAPQSLRIVPPSETFDQGYDVDLEALVGGRPAGDLTVLDDSVAFVRVWHPELVDTASPENWSDVQYEAGYRWWRWRLGDAEAEEIPNQALGSSGVVLFRAGDATYATQSSPDFSATTLLELDPKGEIHAGLSGPGTVLGVVKVRDI